MSRSVLLIAVLFLCGCSSRPGILYDEGDPPRLKRGTVTMKTTWAARDDALSDVRRVKCRDGKITAELVSQSRGHFTGEVPVVRWEKLWGKLLEVKPFSDKKRYTTEPDDPQAQGPHHVVSLELDGRFHEFSAQLRRNILGAFSTGDVAKRLEYSDAIAELVSEFATTEIKPEIKSEPKK